MRFDIYERFSPVNTTTGNSPSSDLVSCFCFSQVADPSRLLFVGTECGRLYNYGMNRGQMPHNVRPIELTKITDSGHGAKVSTLMFTAHKTFLNSQSMGLLLSGSVDRTIKVWSIANSSNAAASNCLVQTLYGHTSAITCILDGLDGSVLTSSEDGSLRMWTPQRGRSIMLNPFFDCTFSFSFGRGGDIWLTALTLSSLGPWICYAADSLGNINLLKKGSEDNEVEKHMVHFTNKLSMFCKWEKVHELGIKQLELVKEENFIVSTSNDTSCKVLDPSSGQVLFLISNRRRCCYTGFIWIKAITSFYLVDELGVLEVFNLYHERIVETLQLTTQTSKQISAVLKCHAGQAVGKLCPFNPSEGHFLILFADLPRRGPTLGSSRQKSVGVSGDLALIHLSTDVNCLEFVGHEGSIINICVPCGMPSGKAMLSKSSAAAMNGSSTARRVESLQISQEESVFFSAGLEDDTLRCWDEYDQQESYQFKSKGFSQVTVMIAVWFMNRIVTGHENGSVCIWNVDTGTKVTSTVLKNTVSSLVLATNSNTKLLLGADYSGHIATWNLTLHHLNPTQLSHVGHTMIGFHSSDDPGILSLAFHEESRTAFSGGNDSTIHYWRLNSDGASSVVHIHEEAVSSLKCSGNYLLSGDEDGNVHLSIVKCRRPSYSSGTMGSTFIEQVLPLCSWPCFRQNFSLRLNADLYLADDSRVFVAQATSSRTKVWEIWLQPRKAAIKVVRSHRANVTFEEIMDSSLQLYQDSLATGDVQQVSNDQATKSRTLAECAGERSTAAEGKSLLKMPAADIYDGVPGDSKGLGSNSSVLDDISNDGSAHIGESIRGEGQVLVHEREHRDLYISASELHSVNHDKHEVCCVILHCSRADSLAEMRQNVLLYLGTNGGRILRYGFKSKQNTMTPLRK